MTSGPRGADSPPSQASRELHERVYAVVRQVPAGQVATYGQIALVADLPSARLVGRALAKLPAGREVPWHRIVNSQGRISVRREGKADAEQRRRLLAEGVLFDKRGRVDFERVGWPGPSWVWLAEEGFEVDTLILKSRRIRKTGAWCRWRF